MRSSKAWSADGAFPPAGIAPPSAPEVEGMIVSCCIYWLWVLPAGSKIDECRRVLTMKNDGFPSIGRDGRVGPEDRIGKKFPRYSRMQFVLRVAQASLIFQSAPPAAHTTRRFHQETIVNTIEAGLITPQAVVEALTKGPGAIRLRGLFSAAQVAEARRVVMAHSEDRAQTVTHFQGQAAEDQRLHLQRRVWNLLAKGDVFSEMSEHPAIVEAMRLFLGSDFIMGSIAANRILPGGPGQEPHIDYPYWDLHAPETFPLRINARFPLNAQVTIPLDPFPIETGATAFMPHTQHVLRYP